MYFKIVVFILGYNCNMYSLLNSGCYGAVRQEFAEVIAVKEALSWVRTSNCREVCKLLVVSLI